MSQRVCVQLLAEPVVSQFNFDGSILSFVDRNVVSGYTWCKASDMAVVCLRRLGLADRRSSSLNPQRRICLKNLCYSFCTFKAGPPWVISSNLHVQNLAACLKVQWDTKRIYECTFASNMCFFFGSTLRSKLGIKTSAAFDLPWGKVWLGKSMSLDMLLRKARRLQSSPGSCPSRRWSAEASWQDCVWWRHQL